jgi:putative PIN family toxin of toxin-antitoxin system
MLRTVLDTNVIIAAARSRSGASALLLEWWFDGRFATLLSSKLILEYEEVLKRERGKIRWNDADIEDFLDVLCARSELVEPFFRLRPFLPDANDEFLLELAFAGGIEYLVTHNVRDFTEAEAFGVKAITPGNFVAVLRGMQ